MTEYDTIRIRAHQIAAEMRERGDARHLEAEALSERARTRQSTRLDGIDELEMARVINDIVRLDKRDKAEDLRKRHREYVRTLAVSAYERAEARARNDLMDEAWAQAEREVGRASQSHAAVRTLIHEMRTRAATGAHERAADTEGASIAKMGALYRQQRASRAKRGDRE